MQPRLSVVSHASSRRLVHVLDAKASIAHLWLAGQIRKSKHANMLRYRCATSRLRSRSGTPGSARRAGPAGQWPTL